MKKYIYSLVIATLAMVGFTACSSDDNDYQKASVSGEQVYFSNETAATVNVTKDATSFSIPVLRVNTAGALNVALTVTDESGLFTIPSSVSFADGESKATLTIGYDPTKLEYDDYKTITLAIGDEQLKTIYGMSAITLSVGIKSPWVSLGKGTITDDIVASIFSVDNYSWKVEIEENAAQPGFYRVVNPYNTDAYPLNEDNAYTISSDTHYLYIHAEDPDAVYISLFATGISLNSDYGEISFQSLGNYYMTAGGYSVEEIKTAGHVGTLKEGIISFPEKELLWGMALYNSGKVTSYGNSHGLFSIVLPGYSKKDFSVAVEYQGIFTNVAGQANAVANIQLGADATNVKAVVIEADADDSAVADALASGDLEGVSVVAGANNLPIEEGMTGKLQIVVAVIDEGEVKDYSSALFEYYGGGANPWKSLGVGVYTDDFVVSSYTQAGESYTYQVEVEESTETPGVYRIKNAYAPVAAAFGETGGTKDIVINAEDPNFVYITEQKTGLDLGYGEISIVSYAGYYIDRYGVDVVKGNYPEWGGTLVDGVITLPLVTVTKQDESTIDVQGFFYDDNYYYAGTNGDFKLVLPSASASVKAKAKKRAAASSFARRLQKYSSAKMPMSGKKVYLISKKVQAVKF